MDTFPMSFLLGQVQRYRIALPSPPDAPTIHIIESSKVKKDNVIHFT